MKMDIAAESSPPAQPTVAAPDWTTIERETLCPLCEYNLRGLGEPRCPECGYAFRWDELLDPAKQKHPYLFEHHPRRNVVSLVRTLLGGLRPRRFWRTLNPAMPSRPRRLALYVILTTALLVVAPLALFASETFEILYDNLEVRAYLKPLLSNPNNVNTKQVVQQYGSVDAYLAQEVPWWPTPRVVARAYRSTNIRWSHIHTVFAVLAWPWLTFASLMIFQWSMRRAKVKQGHVARCVVYSFDWGFWLVPLVLVFLSDRFARELLGLGPDRAVPILASVVFAVYGSYRLGAAYANYLRFEHPYETAMASQLIVLMVVLIFATN